MAAINEQYLDLLDEPPPRWIGGHVGRRLSEALRTLAALPMGGAGGTSAWPAYTYEFEDLLAQYEQGELERTQAQQNNIRLLPSLRDVTRMEAAISWPVQYLITRPSAAGRRQCGGAGACARP